MKRIIHTLLLLVVSMYAMAEGGKSQIPLADPYILLDGDTYYAYGTYDASGIHVYSSDDLRTWKDEGQALNKANTTEQKWFWAPEVYHVGDKYIMYFSANEHLFAATATSPKGPFKQVGSYQMETLLGDEKCIDSHVFFDTNGKAYIFFVRFTDGNCIWQAQLEDDYITPKANTLRKCLAVSQGWENKMGRVTEGPNVIKVGRRYFLTYSGNDYQSQDYAVGYAYTSNIASGTWTKYTANPILHKWDDLVGTGHHSLFYDKEGILRIVFHAHNSTESIHPRRMYIGTVIATSSSLRMSGEPIIRPTLEASTYSPEILTKDWGFEKGYVAAVDLNNDGYLDMVAGGASNTAQNDAVDETVKLYTTFASLYKPTTHKWNNTSSATPFKVADSPSIIPCDINNDGNMDIVAFDHVGEDTSLEAYTGNYGCEGIFLGTGDGGFTTPAVTFVDSDGIPVTFDIKGPSAADVIDIDNDGRLDIVCAGQQGTTSYNVILHNVGTEDDALRFAVEPYETELRLANPIIQVADMNNDGFQDFVISANLEGTEDQTVFTDLYLNDTLTCGHFIRQGLGDNDGVIKRKAEGALLLADFNDDGWTDIYLAGIGDASSGESRTRQRIYLNGCTSAPSFTATSSTISLTQNAFTLSSYVNNAAGVIDWDGDGLYDLVVGGLRGSAKTSSGQLYRNSGEGRMKVLATLPGCTGASVAFPDWNGDGRKDVVINGMCTDTKYLTDDQKGKYAIMCYNLNPTPSRPEAPTDCKVEVTDHGTAILSWTPADSAHKGYTYEVFLKDSLGNSVNCTPAFIGDSKDGVRKANCKGRAGSACQWEFRPAKPGTYTWAVQTVDAAYTGSTFTLGEPFHIDDNKGTAITAPQADTDTDIIYGVDGRRIQGKAKGIYIIKGKGQKRI